jgi:hypothetical protein
MARSLLFWRDRTLDLCLVKLCGCTATRLGSHHVNF